MTIRTLVLAAALLAPPAIPAARADDLCLPRGTPPPVAVRPSHVHRSGRCRFVPAHLETRVERVLVPGHRVQRVVPARFAVRWSPRLGAYVRVLVRARGVEVTWVPARVELRRRTVRVPAAWHCR